MEAPDTGCQERTEHRVFGRMVHRAETHATRRGGHLVSAGFEMSAPPATRDMGGRTRELPPVCVRPDVYGHHPRYPSGRDRDHPCTSRQGRNR